MFLMERTKHLDEIVIYASVWPVFERYFMSSLLPLFYHVFLLSYFVDKAPHFSRLGDEEINAGQNATFQCVAAGRAAEAEKFLLEVS